MLRNFQTFSGCQIVFIVDLLRKQLEYYSLWGFFLSPCVVCLFFFVLGVLKRMEWLLELMGHIRNVTYGATSVPCGDIVLVGF